MATHRTSLEWLAEGRIVKARSKAKRYLVSSDGKTRIALFSEAQTLDRATFTEVAVGDLPKPPAKAVYYTYNLTTLKLWVGSRKDLIQLMRHHKFRYAPKQGRWWKQVPPDKLPVVLAKLSKMGYTPVEQGD